MHSTIHHIRITEGVTLVTLSNYPAETGELSALFSLLAEAHINVDMISQTAPRGDTISLCFSVSDGDLTPLLGAVARLRRSHPRVGLEVSSGNVKIAFCGDGLRSQSGAADRIFALLAEVHIQVRLITTSEVEISVLTAHPDLPAFAQAASELCGIPAEHIL